MNRKLRRENRRRWNRHAWAPNEHNATIQERKARRRQQKLTKWIRERLGIELLPWQTALLTIHQLTARRPTDRYTLTRSRKGYEPGLSPIVDEVRALPSKRQMVADLVNSYLPPEDR